MAERDGVAPGGADGEIRRQLLAMLKGGQAYAPMEHIVDDLPAEFRGRVPEGLPYSPWQILEHMRIAQEDIVSFSMNVDGGYKPLKWPDAYWPKQAEPPSDAAWERSVESFRSERQRFEGYLADGKNDLTAPFAWGQGQNLLREALLLADHTSHHLGEFIVVRRLLGAWKK